MPTPDYYFLQMISLLRRQEEVLLYNLILQTNIEEDQLVIEFLRNEYQLEKLDYPIGAPEFDEKAAIWSAKLVYFTAQLILFRQHNEKDIEKLIPKFELEISASAILSADLCLRFIPDMINQLIVIDAEDPLIKQLESILYQWHYSGIQYELDLSQLNDSCITSDSCLEQLYCDRIITFKRIPLALQPSFKKRIDANLGIHAGEFWNQYKLETISHEINTKTE